MTRYLLDTNVVLRFCNPSDIQHGLTTDAVSLFVIQNTPDKYHIELRLIQFYSPALSTVTPSTITITPVHRSQLTFS